MFLTSTRARRAVCLVIVSAGLVLADAVAAQAKDPLNRVKCENELRPGCDLSAGLPGSAPRKAPTRPASSSFRKASNASSDCHDAIGTVVPCSDPVIGWLGSDGCYYKATDPSADLQSSLGGPGQGPGGWYEYTCPGAQGTGGGIRWVSGAPPIPVAAVSPEDLARRATARLDLPPAPIGISPTGAQLVRLPTWLWIDAQLWTPRTASASVPGVVVTATATPSRVSWATGDGSIVTCAGPGSPWLPGNDPAAASPTCGHTYARSSSSAPGGVFTVTATVSWSITWAGAGQTGTLPNLTTTSTTSVRVNEVQAVVVSG